MDSLPGRQQGDPHEHKRQQGPGNTDSGGTRQVQLQISGISSLVGVPVVSEYLAEQGDSDCRGQVNWEQGRAWCWKIRP